MKIERGLSSESSRRKVNRLGKLAIFVVTVAIHLVVIFTITIQTGEKKEREDTSVFKVVDLEEYVPPPPEPEEEEEPEEPEEKVETPQQDTITEEVIETEEEVEPIEPEETAPEGPPSPPQQPKQTTIEYLPQHKISVPPRLPTNEIREKITYPPLANRQKIEGVVFLELYIDKEGKIRKIVVLKDPGYGFAEAAMAALEGISVKPAKANGVPVAVRFRYPIRFTVK
jgi:protein TonB